MIRLKHKKEDYIEEISPVYIQLITGGSYGIATNFNWQMATTLQDTTIERVSNGIVFKSGDIDILALDEDARIQLTNIGLPAEHENGNAIITRNTEIFTKVDGTVNSYQSDDGRTVDLRTPDFCYDLDTGRMYRANRDSDTELRVWTTEYHNYLIRQFTKFDVSYSEITNTYENETGHTIQYPVRVGKRKIDLELECNLDTLNILTEFFQQSEILMLYQSPTDAAEQFGMFRKTSDIQIQTISKNPSYYNNPFLYQALEYNTNDGYFYELQELYKGENQTGIYYISVSLEEV